MNRKQRRAAGKAKTPAPPDAARDALEWHALGIEAFQSGQLDDAADRIAKAIAGNGLIPSFHYNLAIVRKAQGRLRDAAACYQQAIQLKPDHADAHNNLGNVWMALGERDKARAAFEQALRIRPGNPDTHYSLGVLLSEAGESEQAARHFQLCLDSDPQDSRGAAILLAHLGAGEIPAHASPAQMQNIYDVRARSWDQESSYYGHVLIADALRAHDSRSGLDILDIGCGTGLAGALVRPLARRLDGVDLSSAMLDKARGKSVYDSLEQSDLVSFMSAHGNAYDAVLAAASLIHFGDLQALFRATGHCLREKGLFIFTLFPNQAGDADFAVAASNRLAQSGCFRHSAGYVERLAADNAFSVSALKTVRHELDQDGRPVDGLLGVLRRA